ncbi:NADH dehydrogenase [ubiquinone] 1 beta subcomplex subunit 2, mitochondrial-like [Ruditapes philippinarum]|uniref:NADH dehydrogenase [ubiquinone] 1 beta subcomplex subunit 2, mitochondrial-like n=1 Tax=Ruditapes philippinarum TaxID=129788 RepID=UPI00295AFBE1|nr:NADH dehydrogenase [ubiquinone] 1 beta subcomplex subunit 2, mitochondrial-like [Ruditapes philippinarum]
MSFLRISRCVGRPLCRAKNINKNSKRNGIWDADAPQTYREQLTYFPPWVVVLCTAVPAVVTTYIGYNMYRHPQHYLGEFPKMEPSLWTDEELGIPPDDEDIYPPNYIPLKDRIQ